MEHRPANVVNIHDAPSKDYQEGQHWGGSYQPLTPVLDQQKGRLGVNLTRLPPGRAGCPFHSHALEDEVFYILSGRGLFRYGDKICEVGPGDCLSCPAGSGVAHQLANPFDEDLVYLGMGRNDPNEVCHYPDSGKVLVRSLGQVGYLEKAAYMDGEAELPKIFSMHRK
ncbi:cupin domain-containing protein [Chromobacterium sp. IIBBL 290-4]|uniref:cupin domain-containing protein n=1 Tax=Chromobacterium sp. IIBBL 290-4 TaxID=2953890 RepID=UPI0020B8B404|nr:cupin domain-containing protein [Chromobacterium sp. IIBBL 290-4]UTH72888.1 cupin domain-containing protein [Chromobacterium sp. IIBBL 290-4]